MFVSQCLSGLVGHENCSKNGSAQDSFTFLMIYEMMRNKAEHSRNVVRSKKNQVFKALREKHYYSHTLYKNQYSKLQLKHFASDQTSWHDFFIYRILFFH